MEVTDTQKAFNDPVRRNILLLLKKESMSVGEIANHFEISFPAISRHLSYLRKANLVSVTREGKQIIYELNASVLEEVLLFIESLRG